MAKSLFIFLLASGSLLADPAAAQAVDPGIRTVGLPGDFEVLPGASATERELFFSGIDGFGQGWELADGFGPRFNAFNCSNCHISPRIGGSSGESNIQKGIFETIQNGGGRNVLPPFVRDGGPMLEARLKRKPDGSPDGSVHPLFVISGYVSADGANDASGCNIPQTDFQAEVARNNVSLRT